MVITLIRSSLARVRMDGSASPSCSCPLITIFLICPVICSYMGVSPELLIIIFNLSPPRPLSLLAFFSLYIVYIIYIHKCQYIFYRFHATGLYGICSNHHRGSYTSPALAYASYPFVDLLIRNILNHDLR